MKIGPLVIGKDGGADSTVDGVMFEIKSLFSIGVLRFKNGSRDAWHSHAFNCVSLVLSGMLVEEPFGGFDRKPIHWPLDLIWTRRSDVHRVSSFGTSYVLTLRGPWSRTWFDVEQDDVGLWTVNELRDGRVVARASNFGTRSGALKYVRRMYESESV